MERVARYKRVIGLDIHQAQITACALIEDPDGNSRIEQRQFGGSSEAAGNGQPEPPRGVPTKS